MAGEVVYIFYSYLFGLYVVSLKAMTVNPIQVCNQKDRFYLFY